MRTRFYNTLHFRIPVSFILLLAIVFFGYYQWVENTVFDIEWADGEEDWYENRRETEIAELADAMGPALADSLGLQRLIDDYMETIDGYDLEIIIFDTNGILITSSSPDSLSHVVVSINPVLLDSMSLAEWDFSRYPTPENIEAYENRIYGVYLIDADRDSTNGGDAYLATSMRPVSMDMASVEEANRGRQLRGAASILIYSLISGLILMTWISRRIRRLSHAMGAYRKGDFESRATDASHDELGSLGRDFNRMADRITEMINSLQNAETYRKQLVANISHDLRTPIASLRGYVEALGLRGDQMTPEKREQHLRAMTSNITNLENLISRLFELSQLECEQYEYMREDFSIEELAADLIARLEPQADQASISNDLVIEGELPLVHADPVRIGQVLQNLLENAVKFNKPGGRITLTLVGKDDAVEVRVTDSGIGIHEDDLPHVFERFYTVDQSRHQGGTGLGLAIADRIVKAHGSDLQVVSRQDHGTTFYFDLPAAPPRP